MARKLKLKTFSTPEDIIEYIKTYLNSKYRILEFDDDDIWTTINDISYREFSKYIKDIVNIDYTGKDTEYYTIETTKNGKKIIYLNLEKIGDYILDVGFIPGDYNQVRSYALYDNYTQGSTASGFSSWEKEGYFAGVTAQKIQNLISGTGTASVLIFERPNKLTFSGPYENQNGIFMISLPPKLESMGYERQELFAKLCLADTMIRLGDMRKDIGGALNTKIAEINIDTDIKSEGEQLRDKVIEELEKRYLNDMIVNTPRIFDIF